jgi:hypothetical protein
MNHVALKTTDLTPVHVLEAELRLGITSTYPHSWIAHSTEMTGDGDITGHGRTVEEAAADYCEQYADHEVVRVLSDAWVEINTLGGSFDPSDRRSAGYNAALGDALELLVKLGAKPFKVGRRA